jgi:predicted Fe-Mo cluster-binding NifX family protein
LNPTAIVTTCIAVPLFGDEVSPRFCYAERVLVISFVKGREVWRQVVSLGSPWIPGRMARLSAMGVRTILCGAFNRAYLPAAGRLGMQVITGISGNAEEAVAWFRRGHLTSTRARQRRG